MNPIEKKRICRNCRKIKTVPEFAGDDGTPNPKGRYCQECQRKLKIGPRDYIIGGDFFYKFKKYLEKYGEVLKGQADIASIFPNTSDIGLSREGKYLKFLQAHLPSSCNISLGGFLFNQDGEMSKQLDIIIWNDIALSFKQENKSFAGIDGCVGAIGIKSNLDKNELFDSLINMESIPQHQPLVPGMYPPGLNIPDYDLWPFKAIIAFDGLKVDTIYKHLTDFYREVPDVPINRRPDIIHVIGEYTLTYGNKHRTRTPDGQVIHDNQYWKSKKDPDFFGLAYTLTMMQSIAIKSRLVVQDFSGFLKKI